MMILTISIINNFFRKPAESNIITTLNNVFADTILENWLGHYSTPPEYYQRKMFH